MAPSRNTNSGCFKPRPCVWALLLAGVVSAGTLSAQTVPPALPANAMPQAASQWLQQGLGAQRTVTGNQMTVNLQGPATVLNWNSLDVGKEATLKFGMVNPTDRVLNLVQGGAILNRTTIDGALQSNGQVYIYNPNGILFGKTATVDVNALLATSLKVDTQRFMDGLLSKSDLPQLQMDPLLGRLPGSVVVEGDLTGSPLQRAALTAARNGFLLLAAPEVRNNGVLTAPDGQVVLAAGTRVFLAAPTSAAMRGFLVEVGSQDLQLLSAQADQQMQPSVTHAGQIEVQRGNATLMGRMVNQMGLVSASTSVTLNGSIYLKAQDGAEMVGEYVKAKQGGSLVLGPLSQTRINPLQEYKRVNLSTGQEDTVLSADYLASDSRPGFSLTPVTTTAALKKSIVDLAGEQVTLQGGSAVLAPGGEVSVSGKVYTPIGDNLGNSSQVVMEAGSSIDVSGSSQVPKDMASFVVAGELRGGELADNLVLRDSALRGQTVRFDLRKADGMAVANLSGYAAQAGKTIGELTAAGGTVNIQSDGRVSLQADSRINVSGGWVDVQGGYVNTSKLSLNGRLYDLETAPANLAYTGVVNLANSSANYEAGYRVGYNAGRLQVGAPQLQLQASLKGDAVQGLLQRNLADAATPKGASLQITLTDPTGLGGGSFYVGPVPQGAPTDAVSIDGNAVFQKGFRSFGWTVPGDLRVTQALNLPPVSSLTLAAPLGSLYWDAGLSSAGGKVTASALYNLYVANNTRFDLAGSYLNDAVTLQTQAGAALATLQPYAIQGGSLNLSAHDLQVGRGVSVDVSGGAWLNATNKLTAGAAGSISWKAQPDQSTLDTRLALGPDVVLSGYGLKAGGTLSLTGRNVFVGQPAQGLADSADLVLTPEWLNQGGFGSVNLTANGNLTVVDGTQWQLQARNWRLPYDLWNQPATARMAAVATVDTLPLADSLSSWVRPGMSLSLAATSKDLSGDEALGRVRLGVDARVSLDPGLDAARPSTVTFNGQHQVEVLGQVQVPGGQVNLYLDAKASKPYDAAHGIDVGPQAKLDVAGTANRLVLDATGLASGEVLNGGSIRIGRLESGQLLPAVGYVRLQEGATLDVSGAATSQALRLRGPGTVTEAQVLASSAGSIDMQARESLALGATLVAKAGNSATAGGSLSVVLDRLGDNSGSNYPAMDRVVRLDSAFDATRAATGVAVVPVGNLASQGFTQLNIKSENQIEVGHGVNLALGAKLVLDAPQLAMAGASTAQLSAPYVRLGNTDAAYQNSAAASTDGAATLSVTARDLDLQGVSSTQGIGDLRLSASNDLRLIGVSRTPVSDAEASHALGSLDAGRQLSLTAQQIYPSTLSEFAIRLNPSVGPSTLTLAPSAGTPGPVLSVGGSVSLQADRITQGGRLLAPMGRIALLGQDALVLSTGSVTSVAGAPVALLGRVTNGSDWSYTLANGQEIHLTTDLNPNPALGQAALPAKGIDLRSAAVQVQTGAVVDLSGGGVVKALEFLPGPGGSSDVLSNAWAVLPGFSAKVAPVDAVDATAGLKVGDQVYLSGLPGLAAGYYTLLPGHFALLPGGFAVQAQAGLRDMAAASNTRNADGSWTVSGSLSSSTDGRGDMRTQGFRVLPPAVIRQSSEYRDYDANTFFASEATRTGNVDPALPANGGHLVVQALAPAVAGTAPVISLQGNTYLAGDATGKKGEVDITAPQLEVVATATQDTGTATRLLASEISALKADSVLLGGQRSQAVDGVHVQTEASEVRLSNSASPLVGSAWWLTARQEVRLNAGASLQALGRPDHVGQPLWVDESAGAFLAVSSAPNFEMARPSRSATGSGGLTLLGNSDIASSGSVWMDATRSVKLDANVRVSDGGSWGLSVPALSLGDAAPAAPGTARLNASFIAQLNRLDRVSLQADQAVSVYGDVALGSQTMSQLDLGAAALNAMASSAGVPRLQLTAQRMGLDGRSASLNVPTVPDAQGAMRLNTGVLRLGAGQLKLQGLATTALTATGDMYAAGADGVLSTGGGLTVQAPRLDALDGASQQLQANADLQLSAGGVLRADAAAGLGSSWGLSGRNVSVDTWVYAPSGAITVKASDAATTGVMLTTGRLDVPGVSRAFGSGFAYSPAGRVVLDGGVGNVTLGPLASLDLSATGADAGALTVRAVGGAQSTVSLAGAIKAQAVTAPDSGLDAAPQQGRFSLDVQRMDVAGAFDALNTNLDSAGMTAARDVRVRNGDLTVAGKMRAQDISIAVDNGNLTVSGELDARGAHGGTIALYAAQANPAGGNGRLTLSPSARLWASATVAATASAGSEGDGGRVVLGAANANGQDASAVNQGASLWLQPGSQVDVSAAGAGDAGALVLRAPRVSNGSSNGTEVAVGAFKTQVLGSGSTTLEAVRSYQASTISDQPDVLGSNVDAGLTGRMATDALRLTGAQSAVLARLSPLAAQTRLTPGVEVRSSGDLTVSVGESNLQANQRGWNLNDWRFGQEAGSLTLRAGANLKVLGSISDGFVKPDNAALAMPDWQLDRSAKSWNLRLVGGADLGAARPDATVASTQQGDVRLDFASQTPASSTPVALVRTGTGQISLAAGRDVVLGVLVLRDPDGQTQYDKYLGAAVYTAGRASDVAGAATPKNIANTAYGASSTELTAAAFGRDGGSLQVTAGRDVVGAVVPQLVNDWLFRQGRSQLAPDGVHRVFETVTAQGETQTLNTAWWARTDYLGSGLATLGGGNLSVNAGGSVKDVMASVATNAYLPSAVGTGWVDASRLQEQGGGDLSVRAGKDVLGGQFYVQKGRLAIRADRDVAAGNTWVVDVLKPNETDSQGNEVSAMTALKPLLALGNATADVQAGGNLAIQAIYNPTLTRQSVANVGAAVDPTSNYWFGSQSGNLQYRAQYGQYSAFSTYGGQSAVRLTASGGQAVLDNDGLLVANTSPSLPSYDPYGQFSNALYAWSAPKLKVVSLAGDVLLGQGMGMAPNATGQLELMAQGSVKLGTYGPLYSGVVMLDANPASISNWAAPTFWLSSDMAMVTGSKNNTLAAHTPGQLHANDSEPVRLVALTGNVEVLPIPTDTDTLPTAALVLPKKAEISAQQDVVNLSFAIQHNAATDRTQVVAGRDVVDSTDTGKENPVRHVVTGPGLLSLVAGRDIDLGNSRGVVTRGNLDNVYLPEGGAAIDAVAGAKLGPADVGLTPAQFEAKAAGFMADVVAAAKVSLTEFDQTIASRYAPASFASGNIKVFGSEFKTEQGGSVGLAAPKGSVIAGLVNIPTYLASKSPSENGLFTIRGGALRVLVGQDFIVNQGRVFTLGGGDISLVSEYGNIDAGRGSKTASSAPPPLLTTDASGNTKLDISGSISGSGIATLKTSDSQPPSNVVAIAPRGIFDAGDAGVRSTGKVEITASLVLNGNNISAAAGVTGAVAMDSGSAAAPAPASATTAPPADAARTATAAQSLTLSVDVLGYGAESATSGSGEDDKNKDKNKDGNADTKEGGAAKK
ncbi:filamentous haemagglutinin family protein [Limnohabitans sp.]|uniref:filamentous haemagglutinin family protein n=1 Tax=Limnohabitans sp. TaxID=1907725 RepID=UPI0038BB3EC7